jgi:hypothetical protein
VQGVASPATVLSNKVFFRNVTLMIGQELPYIKQLPLKEYHLTTESLHYFYQGCTINARNGAGKSSSTSISQITLYSTCDITYL